MYVFGNVYMSVGTHNGRKREEGVRFLGAGVTGDCEPVDMGTRNQRQILKSSAFS